MKSLVAIPVMFLLVATFGLAVGAQQPGTLDLLWGTAGVASVPWNPWAIAAYPDGGIVAVTDMSPGWGIYRLDAGGVLITSFGTGGLVTTFTDNSNNEPYDVAVQPDGKILVTGQRITDKARFTVVRLTADGNLDGSFDGDGVMQHILGSKGCVSRAVALQYINQDWKIVVGGYAVMQYGCPAVMRLNSNGTLDTTFGKIVNPKKPNVRTGYIVDTTDQKKIGTVEVWRGMIAIDDQQRIVVGGYHFISYDGMVARYTSVGDVDKTFNGTGRVWVQPPTFEGDRATVWVAGLAVDGSTVYLSGTLTIVLNVAIDSDPFVVSYNANGSLNTSFDSDGFLRVDVATFAKGAQVAVQNNDGKLLLGVTDKIGEPERSSVYRLLSDGSLDNIYPGFGPTGNGKSTPLSGCSAGNVVLVPGYVFLSAGPVVAKFYR